MDLSFWIPQGLVVLAAFVLRLMPRAWAVWLAWVCAAIFAFATLAPSLGLQWGFWAVIGLTVLGLVLQELGPTIVRNMSLRNVATVLTIVGIIAFVSWFRGLCPAAQQTVGEWVVVAFLIAGVIGSRFGGGGGRGW